MEQPIRLGVIVASTREGRLGPTVARWFVTQSGARPDYEIDVIDLAELELPPRLGMDTSAALRNYRGRLDAAEAFVVVTPEYNHGYPASLKHAIDVAGLEWQTKPIAFVSYGGMSGGLRAVEQLRTVFAEMHATTIRDGVSLHNPWGQFQADGSLDNTAGADVALKVMLDRLHWWAVALRNARQVSPYAA